MVYIDFSWPLGQLCQVRSMCSRTDWTQEPGPWETGEIRALKVHLEFQVEWVYFILFYYESKEKFPLLRPFTFAISYFKYQDPPGDCQAHPMIWPEPWNTPHTHAPKRCLQCSLNRTFTSPSHKLPRTMRWFSACCWQSQQLKEKKILLLLPAMKLSPVQTALAPRQPPNDSQA